MVLQSSIKGEIIFTLAPYLYTPPQYLKEPVSQVAAKEFTEAPGAGKQATDRLPGLTGKGLGKLAAKTRYPLLCRRFTVQHPTLPIELPTIVFYQADLLYHSAFKGLRFIVELDADPKPPGTGDASRHPTGDPIIRLQ